MPPDIFLHNRPDFSDLINIVGEEKSIVSALVEKDYWIMHCLYGLKQIGMKFELKGGTSLSKGFGIINRFSEDIDIRIEPPEYMDVKVGPNQDTPAHCESRKLFYDWLANNITIDGIEDIRRDKDFDDAKYRSGGIRLGYKSHSESLDGLGNGVLLEAGFDKVTPNTPIDISSWAYDYAANKVSIVDNRAMDVVCYNFGYTFVEKLQTISTRYRQQQEGKKHPQHFMRHYYDVYCLLNEPEVLSFIDSEEYQEHKKVKFRGKNNPNISENEAFGFNNTKTLQEFEEAYKKTRSLYYKGQPEFSAIVNRIKKYADRL
jgi:hypothetical protein